MVDQPRSRPEFTVAADSVHDTHDGGQPDPHMLDETDPAAEEPPHLDAAEATADVADTGEDEDELPPLTEQISQQLGGIGGLIESGIPIGIFVVANVIWEDSLRWVIAAAVAVAVIIAIVRAVRREPIRHAINGLLGISIGAVLAWNTGDAADFYLPGIIQGGIYGFILMGSVAVKHPLVGWFWAIVAAGGRNVWREDARMVRLFSWLTMLWGVVFLIKNIFRLWLHLIDQDTLLGIVTLIGGYPVTALLVAISFGAVRYTRRKHSMDESGAVTAVR